MGYVVELDCFQGPLDLLLHLIEKQELNIYDIPIAQITEQYLETIKGIEELNLDTACDFLVMAATLLSIKAKMLLPKPPKETTLSEEDEKDPRDELVQHLLFYKKIKEAAEKLKQMERAQRQKLTRPVSKEQMAAWLFPEVPIHGLGMKELIDACKKLFAETEQDIIHQIIKKPFFVKNQMEIIIKRLRKSPRVSFREVLSIKPPILEIVVTFLALLELSKMQRITLFQDHVFGEIVILRREG